MKRSLLVVTTIAVAISSLASPARAQDSLTAGAMQGIGEPGDTVTVWGDGWPAEERVQASFCGNQAMNGSVDCDLASSRSVVTDETGHFQMDMEAALPPEACPCVIFFVSQATPETVRFPFDLHGAPLAPTARSAPITAPALEVVSARVDGIGPLSSMFGGAPNRELVLVIRNTGIEPVVPELDAAWGKGADPKRILDLPPEIEEIKGGAERTYRLPFDLDALTMGGYTIAGEVSGPGGPVSFSTSTSTYPWGWIVLLVVALQIWLIRRWRRRRAATPPPDEEIDLRGGDDDDERAVLALPPGAIGELPPVSEPVSAGPVTIDLDAPVGIPAPDGAATVGLATAVLVATEPEIEPVAERPAADLVLKHAQVIFDEAEAERVQALRTRRIADQLAEALIARAGAQSDSLLAAAERVRAQAVEVLADAEREAEHHRAKAEQLLADAEDHADREHARATQLVAAAEQRAAKIEHAAIERAAAVERDPFARAIHRAVATAFES